jgi:hypothetical protein
MGDNTLHRAAKRIFNAILLTMGVLYFLIDALFLSILRPLRRRLMAWHLRQKLSVWIGSLNRYVVLLLLVIPWLILEPLKPIGFLLFAHHHHFFAILTITGSELVKLTLFEQVFDMAKPKLMSFTWFAWGVHHWHETLDYLRSLIAWSTIVARYRRTRAWLLRCIGVN